MNGIHQWVSNAWSHNGKWHWELSTNGYPLLKFRLTLICYFNVMAYLKKILVNFFIQELYQQVNDIIKKVVENLNNSLHVAPPKRSHLRRRNMGYSCLSATTWTLWSCQPQHNWKEQRNNSVCCKVFL
jgi:hypothetical protein